MSDLRESARAATRISCSLLLSLAAFGGTAAAQAPTPQAIPVDVRSPEREQLATRRSALMTQREDLGSESARHNQRCSSVTEGSPEDAACIAAQQRLTARIAEYRDEVGRFNAALRGAPRAVAPERPPAQTAATAPAPAAPQVTAGTDVHFATVTATGDFSVTTPDGQRITAEQARGRPLAAGSRIATGRDGNADLTFPDGTRLRLTPNSQFALVLEGTPPESIYDVLAGTLRATSARVAGSLGSSRWKVRTQHAVAGVRGTDFHATVKPTGGGSWQVNEGAIELRTPEGRPLALLVAGQVLAWDDSLRITSLSTPPVALGVSSGSGDRVRLARQRIAAWGRENGLLAAVVLLLGLVLAHLATTRRRTG
jgi:hypothetical protein